MSATAAAGERAEPAALPELPELGGHVEMDGDMTPIGCTQGSWYSPSVNVKPTLLGPALRSFRSADAPLDAELEGADVLNARRTHGWTLNFVGSIIALLSATQLVEALWVLTLTGVSFYVMDEVRHTSVSISWTFVSIVIVFPLTTAISMSFTRREQSLDHLANIRALVQAISLAHRDWECDWKVLGPEHQPAVNHTLAGVVNDLEGFLCTPRLYARDALFATARRKTALCKLRDTRALHYARVAAGIRRLSKLCEAKRHAGMPANEASRLNQYGFLLNVRLEALTNMKEYRTPQVLRSMSRFFVVVTPAVMTPYFVWVRVETGSYVYAGFFALFVTFALLTLLNVVMALEDPFRVSVDSINVESICDTIRACLVLDEEAVLATAVKPLTQHDLNALDEAGVGCCWCHIAKCRGGCRKRTATRAPAAEPE